MNNTIEIRGARENNLKNISLSIPKNRLVVITGVSGSGKSSIAMHTLQKECQRQYMESMGMVTDYLSKPNVDSITGLSPSISIGQHNNNRNPRSTVGTVTEIYTYLRVLYARLGERPCPSCGRQVKPVFERQTSLSPIGKESDQLEEENGEEHHVECPSCRHKLPELTMAHFSFNKMLGACPSCGGLGFTSRLQLAAMIDEKLSVTDGGVKSWDTEFMLPYYTESLLSAAAHYGFEFDVHLPIKDLNEAQRTLLFYGIFSESFQAMFPGKKPPKTVGKGKFEGIVTAIHKKYHESMNDEDNRKKWSGYFTTQMCEACHGTRLREESRAVTLHGSSIVEVSEFALDELWDWLQQLQTQLGPEAMAVLRPIMSDLTERIKRFLDIGLYYLTLSRSAVSLSGGEAQRLRIASLLGSGLTGVLYILDEPTTGLHPRDSHKLLAALKRLRDLGNTVLLIEHDTDVMEQADYIIDMGPKAGKNGGYVVGAGSPRELQRMAASVTGRYLFAPTPYRSIPRRSGDGSSLVVKNACGNNLKNVTVSVPLHRFVVITGVSGSGKSTFLFDVVEQAIRGRQTDEPLVTGVEQIGKMITVHQEAIGKISRSNIATYTDLFTSIRNLYASLPDSKRRGLTAKHFSFNTTGGRCEKCKGLGVLQMDMHFLPDVEVKCPACGGKRFKKEILEVSYREHNISELLDLTVEECLPLFEERMDIKNKLELLVEVGLNYVKLGQPASTLSGGEAQRLKLSKELGKNGGSHTLFLLDEPTTGLHPADVERLIAFFNKLVDQGHSVVTIEHHLDVVCAADWIIDFGPEGGKAGGTVIAQGTPEQVQHIAASYTGQYLKGRLSPAKA
ncbi:excinuclease ABC subunit UvrA [Paenibacillus thalictri]|uniref:UvrABC system protein A n=1 Tax=Paenibacillus thalictri TaxID=2527873 RepID=A0A4Q9DU42_9BACL|nr:excinuclease ABC subunit UvrA [Paenibacillus thalictri]TBL79380.1 excinuclease ABC subunit A [Paenibacillus thalictri]